MTSQWTKYSVCHTVPTASAFLAGHLEQLSCKNGVGCLAAWLNMDCYKCWWILFVWQAGKHEAIVKNVHDLLAKLAWDFSPEQLDHLFDCFKVTMHVWLYSGNVLLVGYRFVMLSTSTFYLF